MSTASLHNTGWPSGFEARSQEFFLITYTPAAVDRTGLEPSASRCGFIPGGEASRGFSQCASVEDSSRLPFFLHRKRTPVYPAQKGFER